MDLSSLWNNSTQALGSGISNIFHPQQQLTYQNYSNNDAFNLMQGDNAIVDPGVMSNASGMSGIWDKFKGSSFKDQASAVGSTVGALASAYGAYNTTKTANAQLDFTKQAWNKQYQANANLTNASLADRQNSRVASNSSAYQSVDSYMNKYGVK